MPTNEKAPGQGRPSNGSGENQSILISAETQSFFFLPIILMFVILAIARAGE
jgi:hypothetical protein